MKRFIIFALMLSATMTMIAQNKFCIAKDGKTVTIVVDEQDWKGVIRAANDLSDDVRKVTGKEAPLLSPLGGKPQIATITSPKGEAGRGLLLIGTIGKSRVIDHLIKQKKLDVKVIKGRWEAYKICVVDDNLVIAGSDKRCPSGTARRVW